MNGLIAASSSGSSTSDDASRTALMKCRSLLAFDERIPVRDLQKRQMRAQRRLG